MNHIVIDIVVILSGNKIAIIRNGSHGNDVEIEIISAVFGQRVSKRSPLLKLLT
jgi:hypothetical protein